MDPTGLPDQWSRGIALTLATGTVRSGLAVEKNFWHRRETGRGMPVLIIRSRPGHVRVLNVSRETS